MCSPTTLRDGGVVLGYALTFDEPSNRRRAPACSIRSALAIVRRGDDTRTTRSSDATGAVCSLPLLTEAAGASGFLNAAPDPDGLLRRVPLLHRARRARLSRASRWRRCIAATRTRDVSLRVST